MKVGDIVLYQVSDSDEPNIKHNYASVLPAIVVVVWSETCVNLKVLTDGPIDAWKTSVLKGPLQGEWLPKDD